MSQRFVGRGDLGGLTVRVSRSGERGGRGYNPNRKYIAPHLRSYTADATTKSDRFLDRLGDASHVPYGRGRGRGRGRGSNISTYNEARRRGGFRSRPSRRRSDPVYRPGGASFINRRVFEDPNSCYKVEIPRGNQLDQEFILRSLRNCARTNFDIYGYSAGEPVQFFFRGRSVAEALRNPNIRLTTPTGQKLSLTVDIVEDDDPVFTMDTSHKEQLKLVLARRYDQTTNSLNLSGLSLDGEWAQTGGMPLSLTNTGIVKHIAEVIASHIPQVLSIDMSENQLRSLNGVSVLAAQLKSVKRISLATNLISYIPELNNLKQWSIEEATFDGNPFADRCKDWDSYVSLVRGIFPKLTKLDGKELAPKITFDLDTTQQPSVPETKLLFTVDSNVQDMVKNFVLSFFKAYDMDDRQQLLDAYHQNAVLTLSWFSKLYPVHETGRMDGSYSRLSRNITRLRLSNAPGAYDSFLSHHKSGKLAIVGALTELPATRHIMETTQLDISLVQATHMIFTVTGIFAERSADPDVYRSFFRTFIVVPKPEAPQSGFLIMNDDLQLTPITKNVFEATKQTMQEIFSKEKTLPEPQPAASTVTTQTQPTPVPSTTEPDENIKKQMIVQFCQQSGMNANGSEMCLRQNNWDYQKAGAVFTELQGLGKIPAEYFTKL